MTEIMLGALSGLVLLAGLSVYSALRLAKRTDEMVSAVDIIDEPETPLLVHFPESVFSRKVRAEVTHKEG